MKQESNAKKLIHKRLKKYHPEEVHEAKKLFSFKYPKLFLLLILIILAYYLFSKTAISSWILNLDKLNYLGLFIAGIFISFGFSAPFSVGFLIVAQPLNLFLGAIIAGLGAMLGDMFIFKTIKFSFMDEFKELKKTSTIKKIKSIIKRNKFISVRHYLLYIFAGIMIATPLPDEVGVSMLAGLTSIKPLRLAIISFILHTLAVFLILYFSIVI